MRPRDADRGSARWKRWTLWFGAMCAVVHAQSAAMDESPYPASTSGATISVTDALGVVSRLSWWGIDLALETAGYGK